MENLSKSNVKLKEESLKRKLKFLRLDNELRMKSQKRFIKIYFETPKLDEKLNKL